MPNGGKAEGGALKPPTERDVEAMLDAEGKASLGKLKTASGKDFDKAYVNAAQLVGYRKLLSIQEEYLTVGKNR